MSDFSLPPSFARGLSALLDPNAKLPANAPKIEARALPFIGGGAHGGQHVDLKLGDTFHSVNVGVEPTVLKPGSPGFVAAISKAISGLAEAEAGNPRSTNTVTRFAEKVSQFGEGLKSVALNNAGAVLKLAADEKDAQDPTKVSALADRVSSGEVQVDSYLPGSKLRVALQREIDKRALGAEDA